MSLRNAAGHRLFGLSLPATLCRGAIFTNPKLWAGPPSRSVPPLRIANHHRNHHINQRCRLTFHLAQFLGPAHLLCLGAVPLRKTPLFAPARNLLDSVDRLVLSIPGLLLMAWQVTFELVKPAR